MIFLTGRVGEGVYVFFPQKISIVKVVEASISKTY
jgi:hypothetical protein